VPIVLSCEKSSKFGRAVRLSCKMLDVSQEAICLESSLMVCLMESIASQVLMQLLRMAIILDCK
jgi:hypothetical protein